MRKPHRKGPEIGPWAPAPASDQLIERRMQKRRVGRALERLAAIVSEPDHRARPCRGVVAIAWQIAPHDCTALLGQFARKGAVEPDKAIFNELRYLRVTEGARTFVFLGRHENPHIARQQPSPALGQDRLGMFGSKRLGP